VEGQIMTKTETIITDIYDAWRAQDIGWLASYLPDDFSHMIYLPPEVSPLGGLLLRKRHREYHPCTALCAFSPALC
jgi:hypothetical protein